MTRTPKKAPRGRRPTVNPRMAEMGYLTVEEAAKLAGVAKTTVYGWLNRGVLGGKLEVEGVLQETVIRSAVGGGRGGAGAIWILRAAVEALHPTAAVAG